MNEEFTEGAKATQEVAKTTGKGIDAARNFGGFVSKFISPPAEQLSGMITDKLRFMRWERLLRLMTRANEILAERGLSAPDREVPVGLLLPLVERATLEDNDYLQDRWAALLANAGTSACAVPLHRRFIDTLDSLTPLEASILEKVYHCADKIDAGRGIGGWLIGTHELPEKAYGLSSDQLPPQPVNPDVLFALTNLVQLGCIQAVPRQPVRLTGAVTRGKYLSPRADLELAAVSTNIFGHRFIAACRNPGHSP